MTLELTPNEIYFVQSWHLAVYRWLSSPDSTGWIGSDYNLLLLISQIEILGLADAFDKQSALTAAFEILKSEHALQMPTGLN